jgi:hypothetical protein
VMQPLRNRCGSEKAGMSREVVNVEQCVT